MREIQQFGIPYTHKIQKETVKTILFDIDAKKSDGTICDIADLNKSTIDLVLRNSNNPSVSTTLISSNLHDLLVGYYAQTTNYDIAITKRTQGYKIAISFGEYPIECSNSEYLELKTNFSQASFTSLVLSGSTIQVETIPSEIPNVHGVVPVLSTFMVGTGDDSFDEQLGDDIIGIIAVTDLTATYDASSKASITDIELTSDNGFAKSVSENVLIHENLDLLAVNPTSDVRNLVLYRNPYNPIDGVRLKVKFSAVVDNQAKILVIRLQRPFYN